MEACLGICRELAKRDHDVSIYTTNLGQSGTGRATDIDCPLDASVYDNGVEIRFFAGSGRGRYSTSVPLLRALYAKIPTVDIVHIHSIYLFHSTVGAYLCRRFRVPYVIRPHGTLDPYLRRRHRVRKWLHESIVERQSFRSAAAIQFTAVEEMALATNSRFSKRLFQSAVSAIVPNGVVLPEGFDSGSQAVDVEVLLQRFPDIRGKRVVLFLGRINFKKGLDLLAAAFAQICRKRNDVHLLIAGPDNEGYELKVREWLRAENVLDRVTFTGMQRGAGKNAAFEIAEMFVLPTYSENFGIAVVEAMAQGLPVVVSDRVNIWREIAAAEAGLVVRCDATELATAMASLLDDATLRRSMGEQGRRLVRRSFTWEVVADQMVALYERIVNESGGIHSTVDDLSIRQNVMEGD